MINTISSLIIPVLVLFVIIYGLIKKTNIYDVFVDGAGESFDLVLTMFPCFTYLKVPIEIFPMIIMRPISGSSSLAILNNIFENFGPDSFAGRLASVIQGSTDTTFYILTLYFGSIGIKKIRYALWAGLFADLLGILSAIFLVNIMF